MQHTICIYIRIIYKLTSLFSTGNQTHYIISCHCVLFFSETSSSRQKDETAEGWRHRQWTEWWRFVSWDESRSVLRCKIELNMKKTVISFPVCFVVLIDPLSNILCMFLFFLVTRNTLEIFHKTLQK